MRERDEMGGQDNVGTQRKIIRVDEMQNLRSKFKAL